MERAQHNATRVITENTRSTPGEAGLETLEERYIGAALSAMDRWRNLEVGDVRKQTVEGKVLQRTRKREWREQGAEEIKGGNHRMARGRYDRRKI